MAYCPYKALACAKITRILMDLALKETKGTHAQQGYVEFIKHSAERFINSRELQLWCDMAGLHADDVRKKAEDILKNGLSLRYNEHDIELYVRQKRYREKLKRRKNAHTQIWPYSQSLQ